MSRSYSPARPRPVVVLLSLSLSLFTSDPQWVRDFHFAEHPPSRATSKQNPFYYPLHNKTVFWVLPTKVNFIFPRSELHPYSFIFIFIYSFAAVHKQESNKSFHQTPVGHSPAPPPPPGPHPPPSLPSFSMIYFLIISFSLSLAPFFNNRSLSPSHSFTVIDSGSLCASFSLTRLCFQTHTLSLSFYVPLPPCPCHRLGPAWSQREGDLACEGILIYFSFCDYQNQTHFGSVLFCLVSLYVRESGCSLWAEQALVLSLIRRVWVMNTGGRLVAGSHNRNEFVLINADENARVTLHCFSSLLSHLQSHLVAFSFSVFCSCQCPKKIGFGTLFLHLICMHFSCDLQWCTGISHLFFFFFLFF